MRNLAYLIVLSLIFITTEVYTQRIEPEYKLVNSNIEGIIKNLDSYRFGMINIWELNDVSQKIEEMVKPFLGSQQQVKVDSSVITRFKANYGDDCYNEAVRKFLGGLTPQSVITELTDCYPTILELDSISLIIAPPVDFGGIKAAYLITTKNKNEKEKGQIIALVLSKERIDPTSDLQMAGDEKMIFTFIEQKAVKDPQDETVTLYSVMQNYLDQDNVTPVTAEIQGQGEKWYVQRGKGETKSILKDEQNIDDNRDVQQFLRISDGQPFKYLNGKKNELIVGPDLISWRQYPYDSASAALAEVVATNDSLPKYGVELKYGIDAINYPSFWSERWTLSALWKSVKLGIILPESGWSSAFTDMFSIGRRFTTAGPGIAANFDFPFPVIKSSGVFHLNFGYVSGDPKASSFKKRLDIGTMENSIDPSPDFLIRAHGQLHYTFGVSIDDNYLLRIGLGGTVYAMETWSDKIIKVIPDNGDDEGFVRKYVFFKNETVGGVSTKLEFMAINNSTPFGSSLQYFDETLKANAWLQIPIVYNTFFVKIDIDAFGTLRKDSELRNWEMQDQKVICLPMIKFIFIF